MVTEMATIVAVAQIGATLGNVGSNLFEVDGMIRKAAGERVQLIVFPECILNGYMFDSRADLEAHAIPADGVEIRQIAARCAEHSITAIVGFCERNGTRVYNSAAVVGPSGVIGIHRKRHLPFLGADRFMDKPNDVAPPIYETPVGRVGVAICYEIRFPEVFRTLALANADIIALPTNWPEQSVMLATHFTVVRAAENFVYVLVANRPDGENGAAFLGASQIVDPKGNVLSRADKTVGLVTAEFDPTLAREKRIVFRKGDFEVSPWLDRMPQTYHI
jgi:predicted amidohydrolase